MRIAQFKERHESQGQRDHRHKSLVHCIDQFKEQNGTKNIRFDVGNQLTNAMIMTKYKFSK